MRHAFIIIILFSIISCATEAEAELGEAIDEIDYMLKRDEIDDSALNQLIAKIENHLTKTVDLSYTGSWMTKLQIRYNSDSSIVSISSFKEWRDGFKREKILHFNDTVLLVKRYDVLTEDYDTLNYELVEEIDYLTKNQNIKTLLRRIFPAPLKDTVELRQLNYEHYESNVNEPYYDSELEYARKILNRN